MIRGSPLNQQRIISVVQQITIWMNYGYIINVSNNLNKSKLVIYKAFISW
jgi:hypothetical protein